MRGTTRQMSDAHEIALVEALGGRRTRGSGNQAANPMDGRHSRSRTSCAFAWDGKSSLAASISVSRTMWDKAVEQAQGERPMVALRFYDTERLAVGLDLVAVTLADFSELLERSERLSAIEEEHG